MKFHKKIARTRIGLILPIALFMTANTWGDPINYIDSNGEEKTLASGSYTTLTNCGEKTGSWFVVNGNINCTSQLKLTTNPVNLVLADGAELTINVSQTDAIWAYNLNIYGQKNQTGSLTLNVNGKDGSNGRDIWINNLYVYGGKIHATTSGTDAICATDNVTISGGSVHAEGGNNYYGIKAHCTKNPISDHDIFLDWRNATDFIYANSYSGNIVITSGKSFKDANGIIYSGSLSNNSAIAGQTLTPEYLVQFINIGDSKKRALVNGEYSGTASVQSLNIQSATQVDSIEFNRTFTANKPSTIVLPFSLPEGTEVTTPNAKFYRLTEVVQEENTCKWSATATNITKIDGIPNYPEANIPYIVLLENGGKLTFNLNGAKATFQATNNPTTTVSDEAWQFIGVYSFKEWRDNDGELGLAYGFAGSNENSIPQGKFGKIAIATDAATTGYPFANPFRAYLKKRDSDVKLHCIQPQTVLGQNSAQYSLGHDPETIDVHFIDEDKNGEKTTFMARMNTRTGEFTMLRNYDLKGCKVNAATKAHGAYYGKKVIKQ